MNQVFTPKSINKLITLLTLFSLLATSLPLGVYTAWAEDSVTPEVTETVTDTDDSTADDDFTATDTTESKDPNESKDPVEPDEPTDPADTMDPVEPTDPNETKDPVEPTENQDNNDPISNPDEEQPISTDPTVVEDKGLVDTIVDKAGEMYDTAREAIFGKEVVLTLGDDGVARIEKVELGVTYVAPQNSQVKVVFTELPDNPGSLAIEEIFLNEEDVLAWGLLSDVAYDITSDMENGTFSYDLELPKPEGAETGAKVVYAENMDALAAEVVEEVASEKVEVENDVVSVSELDHFTIFVVVPNDIVSGLLAFIPTIQGWRTESSGNANIELVAASDFGIPNDFGAHVIKMDRPGGPGTNRAFLGYHEENVKLSDIEEVSWNVYSKEGSDTYLNIYLYKIKYFFGFPIGLETASVVFAPGVNHNVWQENSLSTATSIQVRHGSNPTFSSFQDLIASQYGEWKLRVDGDARAGIVIVSGSSNPKLAQEHYVDGVTLTIKGEEKHYNFVYTDYYDTVGVPSPIYPNGETFAAADFPVNQTWTPVTGAVNYVYESYKDVDPEVDGSAVPIYTSTTTVPNRNIGSAGNPPSQGEGVYYWRVKAVNEYGHESDWSTVAVFTYNNHPDPLGQNQLNIGGHVYRDHKLNDCFGKTSCENRGEILGEGWVVNLYEDNAGTWDFLQTTTTDASGNFKFATIYEAGTYYACIENQNGWTQQTQNWSGTPYHIATANASGNGEEGPYCRVISYDDTADRSNKFYFGVVDTKKPVTEVLSPDSGNVYRTDNLPVVSATSKDEESGLVQVIMNLYGPGGLIKSCVNQPLSPAVATKDFACDLSAQAAHLTTEGDYYLKINSRDAGNNTSNTIVWEFTIDNTAPDAPAIIKPTPRQWFKTTPIVNEWTSVVDAGGIEEYQVAYAYDDGHTFGGSTCVDVTEIDGKSVSGCRNETGTSRGHTPSSGEQGGVTIWVRAIDKAGNASPWSPSVHYYYDATAPVTTLVTPTGTVGNTFVVSGEATDNLSLNRVYVQLVHRQTSQRYGGTTIHLSGTAESWSRVFDAAVLGLPDGEYAAHVSVVDNAGNTSSVGWSDNFTLDTTPTAPPTSSTVTTLVEADDLEGGSRFVVSETSDLWFFYNDLNNGPDGVEDINNSLGSFVTGPGSAPLGSGSAEITVNGELRRNLATYQFRGTKLSDITELKYSTYNPSAGNSGSPNRAGYLQFNVSFDGSDNWQRRLTYLPAQNGTVLQDTWQEWDAINGGAALWSWSDFDNNGGKWPDGNTNRYRSWSDITTTWPDIKIKDSDGFLGIRVGEPYADGYTENIDQFVMGIKTGSHTHTETFDFEPTAVVVLPPTVTTTQNNRSTTSGGMAARTFSAPAGQVLGVSTDGDYCVDPYLTSNLGLGLVNLAPEVIKLQNFLNTHINAALPVTGVFGELTRQAVMSFQAQYASDILAPWGISTPTGMVYHTTKKKINEMACDYQREFPLTQDQLDEINNRQGQTSGPIGQTAPPTPVAIVAGASTADEEPEAEEDNEVVVDVIPPEPPKPGFFKKIWNSIFGN